MVLASLTREHTAQWVNKGEMSVIEKRKLKAKMNRLSFNYSFIKCTINNTSAKINCLVQSEIKPNEHLTTGTFVGI